MRALSIICAVSNFIASTLGYMIILSLLLGFGNASVKGPWGAWRINAGSAPDSDRSRNGGDAASGSVHESAGRRHRHNSIATQR